MFVEKFDDFIQKAEQLYLERPMQTRYVIKYRHKEGKLVLKVTDDKVCLKHYLDYLQDLKKLERLTLIFLRLSSNKTVEQYSTIEETAPIAPASDSTTNPVPKRRKK